MEVTSPTAQPLHFPHILATSTMAIDIRRADWDGRNEAGAWRWVDEATALVEADERILHGL